MASLIDRIVSGGQTGADRAALDFAIRHKIPHGGWVPKGRLAEDGPLPAKYKVQEMPTDSYQDRTEQNVIDSDGTVIISHGKLTGGSAYTRKMAKYYGKPCLHVDLKKLDVLPAAVELLTWINERGIKVLNVAGPRASKDPKIYKLVKEVLESLLILDASRKHILSSLRFNKTPTGKDIKQPETLDEAVDRLMSKMSLKDLNTVANMTEDDLINLHFTVGMWIRNNFVYPRNVKLLESCREVSGQKSLHWAQMHMVILHALWKKLQETHKLKVVK
jgi:hypothetical protein